MKKILCKDANGNFFRVNENDPRYLNKEIVAISKGTIVVKDFSGNSFRVNKDDPRYLSGELVFISRGPIPVLYKDKIFLCKPNDPNVLNKTYTIVKSKKKKYINTETEEVLFLYDEDPLLKNTNIVKSVKFLIYVRDASGKCFSVLRTDERLKTGELFPLTSKYIYNCDIHGRQQIDYNYRLSKMPIPEEYKTYCPECVKYYLSDEYIPSDDDIKSCKLFLNTFKFTSSKQRTEDYFIKWVPKFYKIINDFSLDSNIELLFSEKTYFLRNDITTHPKCIIEKCPNLAKLSSRPGFGFNVCCDEHKNHVYSSKKENEVYKFINSIYNKKIEKNYRKINNKEIDIYIPELKTGFEYNGLYWHSEKEKDKNHHYDKYKFFKTKGIKLITIWADDWEFKQDIVKSIISNSLNLSINKFNARDCTIKELSTQEKDAFLLENHIQGKCISSINLGLMYKDEIISIMTFGKKRMILNSKSKNNEYELLRFCSKLNSSVRGAASKLFNYFVNTYKPTHVMSFANLDFGDGNMYKQLGFEDKGHTGINYWWSDAIHRYHRSGFMKHKLVKEGYDKNKTEAEIMYERKFIRIWGNGNQRWEWTKTN